MTVIKLPQIDKQYEDIYRKDYLSIYVGDAIISHSSLKTLRLFEEYL